MWAKRSVKPGRIKFACVVVKIKVKIKVKIDCGGSAVGDIGDGESGVTAGVRRW